MPDVMRVATRCKHTTPGVQIPWSQLINTHVHVAEYKQVSRFRALMESTSYVRIIEYTLEPYCSNPRR
jgi:hypothetical protein